MKFRYLFMIMISIPLLSNAQWTASSQKAGALYSVSFSNKDTLIVSTSSGNFLSKDGARTYESIGGMPQQNCYNIIHKTQDTIFANIRNNVGLLRSANGGLSWDTIYLTMTSGDTAFRKSRIAFVYFFDESRGILAGDTSNGTYQIFTTNNGGLKWKQQQPNDIQTLNMRLFHVLTVQKGYNYWIDKSGTLKLTLNEKAILTVSNYGQNWQVDSIKQPEWTFRSAAFKDSLNGIASISTATALVMAKTTDGGKNWTLLRDSLKENASASLRYVKGTDRFRAFYFAFGFKGAHVSYNDGESWQRMDTFRHDHVFFRDAETGISLASRFVSEPILYYNPDFVGLPERSASTYHSVLFYPNPASKAVAFNQVFNQVELFDIQGKKWLSEPTHQQLDISGLPNGFYTVYATDKTGAVFTQKLIVAH